MRAYTFVYTDQITGENIGNNATSYWSRLVQPCVDTNTNWVTVFGNHGEIEYPTAAIELPPVVTVYIAMCIVLPHVPILKCGILSLH